jgi:hypothetical protein
LLHRVTPQDDVALIFLLLLRAISFTPSICCFRWTGVICRDCLQ